MPNDTSTQPPPPTPPSTSQTKACPFCAEQILLSAVKCKHCGEFLDGRNRQVVAAPQLKKAKLQVEIDIWKGNPSYLYYFWRLLAGVLLLPLYGFGLLFILLVLMDRNAKVYTLTNKRVMSKAGIISRQIHEVGTKDIRNINVKQGILERMFDIGTVEIASAGTGGVEVSFVGINDPIGVRNMIRIEKDEEGNRD